MVNENSDDLFIIRYSGENSPIFWDTEVFLRSMCLFLITPVPPIINELTGKY